jgi:hypothetical protein
MEDRFSQRVLVLSAARFSDYKVVDKLDEKTFAKP